MKNKLLATASLATAVLTIAGPAQAAPTVTFTPGDYALPAYTTAAVFQNFESHPAGGAAYVPDAGETTTGDVRVYSGSAPGLAAQPTPDAANRYLSIVDGSYTVGFAAPVQFFSFVLGSLDNYNALTLGFSDGSKATYTGTGILDGLQNPSVANGPYNSSTSGRVSYDENGGAGITYATFSSGHPAFEIDDLAAAVPEIGTWAMMLLGVGVAGVALRRRRSTDARGLARAHA